MGKKKNIAKFELNLNNDSMMIIPMDVGTVFTYSGFLLTHRQQIHNETSSAPPFINIVSYNSKRLFENMLQSFRRYLEDNEKKKNLMKKNFRHIENW